MIFPLFIIVNLLFSFFLTKKVYLYLNRKNIIDVPNQRSLHIVPKVRGGGIAILLSYEIFILIMFSFNYLNKDIYYTQVLGGLLIGFVGWHDDKGDVPVLLRFVLQIVSAIVLLYFFNWFSQLNILGMQYNLLMTGNVIFALYTVWLINLYNFMDGIDGIAISQLIVPSIFIAVFFTLQGHLDVAVLAVIMVCSALPFYKYNWPSSKMFMGDVLSGFLGFYFASLTLYINNYLNLSFLLIPVLLAPFIFDATFTLIKRLLKREKVWRAHNSHYYQQFAKVYGHKTVTVGVIAINIFLYIPAYLILKYPEYDLFISLIVYFFIAILMYFLKGLYLSE